MPDGKPAGQPCVQLDEQLRCRLFGQADRPLVCASLTPTREMCGEDRSQALFWLSRLEAATSPTTAGRPQTDDAGAIRRGAG